MCVSYDFCVKCQKVIESSCYHISPRELEEAFGLCKCKEPKRATDEEAVQIYNYRMEHLAPKTPFKE